MKRMVDEKNVKITNLEVNQLHNTSDGYFNNIYIGGELQDDEENDYLPVIDLSSGITDVAGLTYGVKKAYKQGNVVTITICAQNNTGSTITAGTTLVTLGIGLYNSFVGANYNYAFPFRKSGEISTATIDNTNGNLSITADLANSASIYLFFTYAVA